MKKEKRNESERVANSKITKKEKYQKPQTKIVEAKVEKGYATSQGPIGAPDWRNGSW